MFLKLEGEIVSAKALKKLNLEKISTEINKLIEALPEEERRKGKGPDLHKKYALVSFSMKE